MRARVVFPQPGGPQKIMRRDLAPLVEEPQRTAGTDEVLLPAHLVQRGGPAAIGQRSFRRMRRSHPGAPASIARRSPR